MTTPEGSGAAPPPVQYSHATNVLLRKPLTSLRAARLIATVTIAWIVTFGPGAPDVRPAKPAPGTEGFFDYESPDAGHE